MHPSIAIAILNWNGRKYLEQFLPFVVATTYPNATVYVIDNASTDDSIGFLEHSYPRIVVVSLDKNYGFAGGYNQGLKSISADYFILLNSDVEVEAGWLEPMVKLMESDKMIGACQPKIRQFHNKTLFEYAGAAGGWIDFLGYPFAKGRIFDVCEVDKGQYDQQEPIFWASGAAMMIRASVYRLLGGFDNYFFAHQEEIDLCWRLQNAGYLVYSCPASLVYHVGGGTLPKGNARKVYLNFRNNLIMMAKNLPASEAIWKIFLRFNLDAISAVKSLFAGQGTYFIAVIEAHIAFFYWLFFHNSKQVMKNSTRHPLHGLFNRSVVWRHFARGRKRFSEIVEKKR